MEYELGLIEVPLESQRLVLKKLRLGIEKELHALKSVKDHDHAVRRISKLKGRLQSLKAEYTRGCAQLKARANFLMRMQNMLASNDPEIVRAAVSNHLDVLICDYLLSRGHTHAAELLAEDNHIEDLVDFDLYRQEAMIVTSLASGDTQTALKWCHDNQAYLKKFRSPLEFELRLYEFEKLAASSPMEAVIYSRTHLAKVSDLHIAKLVAAAGALVRPPNLEKHTSSVIQLFQETFKEMHGRPAPLLMGRIGLGLAAMRTRTCSHGGYEAVSRKAPKPTIAAFDFQRARSCPACSNELGKLAEAVPYAQHWKNVLEHDPVVLPNGYAYSREKLVRFSRSANTDKIVDPMTLELFENGEAEKIFPL